MKPSVCRGSLPHAVTHRAGVFLAFDPSRYRRVARFCCATSSSEAQRSTLQHAPTGSVAAAAIADSEAPGPSPEEVRIAILVWTKAIQRSGRYAKLCCSRGLIITQRLDATTEQFISRYMKQRTRYNSHLHWPARKHVQLPHTLSHASCIAPCMHNIEPRPDVFTPVHCDMTSLLAKFSPWPWLQQCRMCSHRQLSMSTVCSYNRSIHHFARKLARSYRRARNRSWMPIARKLPLEPGPVRGNVTSTCVTCQRAASNGCMDPSRDLWVD